MEDTHFVYHSVRVGGRQGEGISGEDGGGGAHEDEVHMFGVFDGHGGAGAAKHCSQTMPWEVAAALHEQRQRQDGAGDEPATAAAGEPSSSSEGDVDVAAALRLAFVRVEAAWMDMAGRTGDEAGATALLALVVVPAGGSRQNKNLQEAPRLWVANAGDCRCVLSRGGAAVQVSRDHTASPDAFVCVHVCMCLSMCLCVHVSLSGEAVQVPAHQRHTFHILCR